MTLSLHHQSSLCIAMELAPKALQLVLPAAVARYLPVLLCVKTTELLPFVQNLTRGYDTVGSASTWRMTFCAASCLWSLPSWGLYWLWTC